MGTSLVGSSAACHAEVSPWLPHSSRASSCGVLWQARLLVPSVAEDERSDFQARLAERDLALLAAQVTSLIL
jgi:hypothetical protein